MGPLLFPTIRARDGVSPVILNFLFFNRSCYWLNVISTKIFVLELIFDQEGEADFQ